MIQTPRIGSPFRPEMNNFLPGPSMPGKMKADLSPIAPTPMGLLSSPAPTPMSPDQDESESQPAINMEQVLKKRREKLAQTKLNIPPEGGSSV